MLCPLRWIWRRRFRLTSPRACQPKWRLAEQFRHSRRETATGRLDFARGERGALLRLAEYTRLGKPIGKPFGVRRPCLMALSAGE